MRRFARAVIAGAILATLLPAPASAAIPKAITWRVDHQAKTITIAVRMTLYPACSEALGVCEIDDIMVNAIRQDILDVWNVGYSYKCYKLVFEVDIAVDNTASRFTNLGDRVGVRIDQTAGTDFENFVHGVGTGPWDSTDPSDKHVPTNDIITPTTWAFPATVTHVYAHEFGHILGMIDTYTRENGENVRIPDAPDDIMSGGDSGVVDQQTIDLLVKRSGVVKDSDLQCDYRIDHQVGWYRLTAIKCDTPEGTWEIGLEGEFALPQGALVSTGRYDVELKAASGKDPTKPLTGRWEGTVDVGLKGVPGAAAGAGVHMSGTASFDPMAKQMILVTKKTVGTSFANVQGYSSSGGVDPAKDVTIPVEVGDFCLE